LLGSGKEMNISIRIATETLGNKYRNTSLRMQVVKKLTVKDTGLILVAGTFI
jgi:hypothetical protein